LGVARDHTLYFFSGKGSYSNLIFMINVIGSIPIFTAIKFVS
jgi:hypothetical protein